MGIQPNKYHMTDDGKVYRVNEDGSFTSIGNVEDLDKKPSIPSTDTLLTIPTPESKPANTSEVGWWKRNYNWLWVTTLVIFIGWFISCLSCSEYDENHYWYADHYEHSYVSYFEVVFEYCFIILLALALSWFFSSRTKAIFKWLQIAIIVLAIWGAYVMTWYLDTMYCFLLLCLALIPFSIWIGTVCLSIFRLR